MWMSLVLSSWSNHHTIILFVFDCQHLKSIYKNIYITIFKSNSIFSTHPISLHIAPMFYLKINLLHNNIGKNLSHTYRSEIWFRTWDQLHLHVGGLRFFSSFIYIYIYIYKYMMCVCILYIYIYIFFSFSLFYSFFF